VTICIPIEDRPEGGMFTFVGQLRRYLDRRGIAHTTDTRADYDILFANSWVVPYEVVNRVKCERAGVRVAHRVDGSSKDYGGYSTGDVRQARVNLLADVTVFQSRYSRLSTTTKFHVVQQDGPVIYNPVDLDTFTPEGPRIQTTPGRVTIVCASWSTNPGKGTREFDRLAAAHPEIDFVLCGRFEGLSLRPNLIHLGHVSRSGLAQAFRSCDVFLNLSENDPAPNVVTEALASGLPVLYRDSGGVPELVGEAGLPITTQTFRAALDEILANRTVVSRAARARAAATFDPDLIFPQYLEAMNGASRRPLPTSWTFLRSAIRGFPVLSFPERAAAPSAAPPRRARSDSSRPQRVGWTTYDTFQKPRREFADLDPFTGMRVGNVARWINAHTDRFENEIYDQERAYDVVVFQKMMSRRCQREVERLQAAGTLVVFDANVNYYEIWGDYPVPGTKPTLEQQRDAIWMTRHADWVVADSSYLATVARKFAPRVTWIPDNVDPDVYRGTRRHEPSAPLRLVWSGVGRKATHLGLIRDVLAELRGAVELLLVCDDPSLAEIQAAAQWAATRIVRFTDRTYATTLLDGDVIISPKYLTNGYEMAHTEYKISLGMAVGLPAVASPQPSYVEAISPGGGIVAHTPREWLLALTCLAESSSKRAALGALAQQTVAERYTTPVVARQYLDLLTELTAGASRAAVRT
jgi:glycosyltransferase involved in cell wall biosynthesis